MSSGRANTFWAALVGLFWMFSGKARQALVLVVGTVCGSALTPWLKELFARPRPPGSFLVDSFGFPSGHALSVTLFSILLVWLLTRRHRGWRPVCILGAMLWVGVVGYSRVSLGVHYLTDVIGGYFFGVLIALGIALLSRDYVNAGGRPSNGRQALRHNADRFLS